MLIKVKILDSENGDGFSTSFEIDISTPPE